MDTDALSNETYAAVFYTSDSYHHNLTLQFGLLASHFKNDDDYLEEAQKRIENWKADLNRSLNAIFFDTNKPSSASLLIILNEIENKINAVKEIPIKKRTFEFKI